MVALRNQQIVAPNENESSFLPAFAYKLFSKLVQPATALRGEDDLETSFCLATLDGFDVTGVLINPNRKPQACEELRKMTRNGMETFKERLLFAALLAPAWVTVKSPVGEDERKEIILMHCETPHGVWFQFDAEVTRLPDGSVQLGRARMRWLEEGDLPPDMAGFFCEGPAAEGEVH